MTKITGKWQRSHPTETGLYYVKYRLPNSDVTHTDVTLLCSHPRGDIKNGEYVTIGYEYTFDLHSRYVIDLKGKYNKRSNHRQRPFKFAYIRWFSQKLKREVLYLPSKKDLPK